MDAKKKATLNEMIGQQEETDEEKKNPETLDLEEPRSRWLLKTLAIILLLIILGGLGYTAYLSYTSTVKVSNENKIENTISVEDADKNSTPTKPDYVFVDASDGLNLRESASATSAVLLILPDKAQLEVVSEDDGWYKVMYEQKTGYVRTDFTVKVLSPSPSPSPAS